MAKSKIEWAKVMCWECKGWVEHNKIHICPAAPPLTFQYPDIEFTFKGL